MAPRPPASNAEVHQASQSHIADALGVALVAKAWPEFDPTRIKATLPRLSVLVSALIHQFGRASGAQAVTYYRAERQAAGISGRITVPQAPLPTVEQVQKELSWATGDLYGTVTPEKIDAAETKVVGVAEKLTLDVGRETIIDAVAKDRQAKGWARVPEADACSFCAMLATRGMVYKGESFTASNAKFTGSGAFKVHDHCRCHLEPVFTSYEPSAQIRQWQADYKRLTDEFGKSGRDIHVAWRQHIEGREVTGPTVKRYARP